MCCNKKYGCLYVRFGLNACTCIWLSWDQDNSWKITITHESCKIVRVSVYDAPLPLSSLTHASTDKEIDDFLACFFISLGKSTPPPTFKTHVWERCFWNIYEILRFFGIFRDSESVRLMLWIQLALQLISAEIDRKAICMTDTQFQTLLISCWTHSFEIKTNQSSPSLNEINHK